MPYSVSHFINGVLDTTPSTRSGEIYNPATGQVIGNCPFADNAIINQAVAAAKQAFPTWSATPALQRARILFNYKQLLEQHIDELAQLVTREHGKLTADARGSILRGIELVEVLCGIPQLLKGTISTNIAKDIDCHTERHALGICVGVSPFNFPVMVPIWMFVSAIACGNTFVLKPSEKDPSVVLRLAQLLQQAGLPNGVLNIVNGDQDSVNALIEHPDVAAVTAVASTPVAKHIYQQAIKHGKRSHTFGGAKNHCVIMPDADNEQVANALLGAAYGSAGERCMAISVAVVVGDSKADALIALLADSVRPLRVGPGELTDVDMGPLITAAHRDRVIALVTQGVAEGAQLVVDGRNLSVPQHMSGFFMGGCLFDRVQPEMQIYQQEIFGPVLCVMRVANLDQAIALVNANPYGNGTAIFTNDGGAARYYSARVEVGMVGINIPIPVPVSYHSFGGWKQSFYGDLAMHGDQSLQFYTRLKTVTTRWPEQQRVAANFIMPTH